MALVKLALLAVIYLACAKLSFFTSYTSNPAGPTPVWIPSGFSLAAVLIFGRSVWPAIMVGSIISDFSLRPPFVTGLGLIAANTLEPLIASFLLQRYTRFNPGFESVRDVSSFIVVAALLSTAASATIGVTDLLWGGQVPVTHYFEAWWDWWVANVLSDLLVAPVLLAWRGAPVFRAKPARLLELAGGTLLATAVAGCVFFTHRGGSNLQQAYWIYPFVIWLAIRFDFRATMTGILFFSIAGIWATVTGRGPFVAGTPFQSLASVQAFLAITAVTGLVLATVVGELRVALRLRDEFLSIASHELKTPLTSLTAHTELFNRYIEMNTLSSLPREKQLQLARVAKVQILRLNRLVNDLLEVTRIVSGKMTIIREELDLSELVREIIERYGVQLQQSRCEVRLDLESPLRGGWDLMRTEQIIVNLLSNAAKFGEGRPIEIVTRRAGSDARLSVRDFGIGISTKDQGKIFGRFERAVSIRSFGGLGLGLYISRQIAQAQGGSIRFESEEGKGAVFILELPIVKAEARRAA